MRISSLFVLATLVVMGCRDIPPITDDFTGLSNIKAGKPNGFYCGLRPSQAYGPGYLYRVDETGADLLVRDLGDKINVNYYVEALGTQEASVTISGGLTVSLMQPFKNILGNIDPSVSRNQTTRVSFSEGRSAKMTDDDAAAMLVLAEKQFIPREGSRYYIVRDAVQAKGIQITLSKTDEARLGGEAGIANLVKLAPNFTYRREDSSKIDGKFPIELNVCIRVTEVLASTGEQSISPDGQVGPSIEWSNQYAGPDIVQQILNAKSQ